MSYMPLNMASIIGNILFLSALLSFSAQICVCTLHTFSGTEVLNALDISCVIAVTEHASAEVYNAVQYLADVSFADEAGVVIGLIELDRFRWKDGRVLSWENTDSGVRDVLYFRRKAVDRTCLLTPSTLWSRPPARTVPRDSRDVMSLVRFVNGVCNVYRTPEGNLSSAGIHRQYILRNLFYVENITDINMGRIYGQGRCGEMHKGAKNDNSSCQRRPTGFYVQRDGKLDEPLQCNILKGGKTYVKRSALHAASITECSKIELPSFNDFFENYLLKSKPVIIKNAAREWPAFSRWTNSRLRRLYGDTRVHIKLTPSGDYEGVEPASNWEDFHTFTIPETVREQLPYPDLVVVRPATLDISFSEFLDLVEKVSNGTVKNLSAYLEYTSLSEYFKELLGDVTEMPFISNILNLKHQNIWLSDGNTLGKLHFDPFDNFLCQISGQKEVILFSPHKNTQLYEAHIPEALLGFNKNTSTFRRKSLLDSTSMVMSPVDILHPDFERFPRFAEAHPMNCTLSEGDVLYLPAFWWHEVQSRPSLSQNRNLAVNFWYEPFLTREFPCPHCPLDVNPTYSHLL